MRRERTNKQDMMKMLTFDLKKKMMWEQIINIVTWRENIYIDR